MSNTPLIKVSVQQSRFHAATLDADTSEVDLSGVTIAVGEKEVLVDAHLNFKEGVRYALVGRNGAGKSTLFRCLADRLIPGLPPSLKVHLVTQVDETQHRDGISAFQSVLEGHTELQRLIIERDKLSQAVESNDDKALSEVWSELEKDEARLALEEARRIAARRSGARGKKARAEEIQAELHLGDDKAIGDARLEAMARLDELHLELELLSMTASESRVRKIMTGLGFTATMMDSPYTSLSGGWRSRVRLATALIVQTDILILDEPTNFMDLPALLWLEETLPTLDSYSTLLITSHDQTFLDRIAESTVSLRHQRLDYFKGNPSAMCDVEAEAHQSALHTQEAMAKKKEHIERSISEGRRSAQITGDENRLRMIKSRQKKLDDRWGLEESAKGTRFKLSRDMPGYHFSKRAEVVVSQPEPEVSWRFDQNPDLRQKASLVSLENVSVGWDGRVAVQGINLVIHPGSTTVLVGPNGRGKSTLAAVIASKSLPLKGTAISHPQARIGYFSQHAVEVLSDTKVSAIEHLQLATDVKPTESQARGILGRLGLSGATASHTPVHQLSGGQKVRLVLACLMFRPPHLLILDEVTTHLDVQSIRALAGALGIWEGAIVLVTHDRWFAQAAVRRNIEWNSSDSISQKGANDCVPGSTYLVRRDGLRELTGGLEEYEAMARKRLTK